MNLTMLTLSSVYWLRLIGAHVWLKKSSVYETSSFINNINRDSRIEIPEVLMLTIQRALNQPISNKAKNI